jgi:hypothetical protein
MSDASAEPTDAAVEESIAVWKAAGAAETR